ncbi:DivIVA domain-containing protein [Actinokineospora guangxiensis]|uniref:DivIVA domain-containing protein n=1 Tax=Actinokineospora guangxiensis TaxID=1490288 RepID=A0ABW0ELG7_9PSEU
MVTPHDGRSAGFSVVRHGYDRTQVDDFLRQSEDEAIRAAAERDETRSRLAEVSGELEIARREITALSARLDQLSASDAPDAERTLQTARTQAAEITARARAAAETAWSGAEEASTSLRDRYRRMLADLDRQHQELHTDHKKIMDGVRQKSVEMTVAADKRRQDLDDKAEAERKRVQRQFDEDMAAKRAELAKEIEAERARVAEESRGIVADATAEAERRIASATSQVERLTALREQLATRLRGTSELITRSSELLEPLEGEAELAPDSPAALETDKLKPVAKR